MYSEVLGIVRLIPTNPCCPARQYGCEVEAVKTLPLFRERRQEMSEYINLVEEGAEMPSFDEILDIDGFLLVDDQQFESIDDMIAWLEA